MNHDVVLYPAGGATDPTFPAWVEVDDTPPPQPLQTLTAEALYRKCLTLVDRIRASQVQGSVTDRLGATRPGRGCVDETRRQMAFQGLGPPPKLPAPPRFVSKAIFYLWECAGVCKTLVPSADPPAPARDADHRHAGDPRESPPPLPAE